MNPEMMLPSPPREAAGQTGDGSGSGSGLRIVAIAMVGNEADIVEAFVRDNIGYVDHMLIAEHNSFDGTREILAALVEEGLSLTVRRIDTPAYRQSAVTNALLEEAVDRFDPHWIIPLDADELLETESRSVLEAELRTFVDCHARLRWIHHVPTAHDDPDEDHPARRLRHRYDYPPPDPRQNPYVWKLALNSELMRPYLDRYDLEKGSHRIVFKGGRDPALPPVKILSDTVLRHYPVRSFEQLSLKAGIGFLQGRLAGKDETGGTHVPRLNRLLLQGRCGLADLQHGVREYLDTGRVTAESLAQTQVVLEPKRNCCALRYRAKRLPATAALLRWIEKLGGTEVLAAPLSARGSNPGDTTLSARFDYCPWLFWGEAPEEVRQQQLAYQAHWAADGRLRCGARCYVSAQAGLAPDRITLGDDCYIAAQAYVTGEIETGHHCTINPFAVVRGKVKLGDHVRVGAHASILGFNHRHARLDQPIHQQGLSSRGIGIGDDVWIGSGALLLDGIRVGSHCIVAAGAVVTRDVPDWAVVAGNPAKIIRDRRDRAAGRRGSPSLAQKVAGFGSRVAQQWPDVIRRCETRIGNHLDYSDVAGTRPTSIRALADAIEIAAAFGGLPPGQSRETLIARLRSCQDPANGMPIDPLAPPGAPYRAAEMNDGNSAYMILSLGYALMCLGSHFALPFGVPQAMNASQLNARLAQQPWKDNAWAAGAWVDAFGTALWMNRRFFGLPGLVRPLFAWLQGACDPATGLWGDRRSGDGWLEPVNGFYRLTRGTYAQFDMPVPYPDAAVDTILEHIRINEGFETHNVNACNLLDVVHPLWLLSQSTEHRREEGLRFIERQLSLIPDRWIDGAGFSFAPGAQPGLQGTEMWLSIVFVAADALGIADELGYVPRGVHRLRPAEAAHD